MSPGPRAQPSGRTIGTPGCDLSGDGRLSAPAGRTARMTAPGSDADQLLELPGFVRDRVAEGRAKARATKQRKAAEAEITDVDPVARVLVDVPLAHLDRPLDYAAPVAMAEAAQPGWIVTAPDVQAMYPEPTDFAKHVARLESHLHAAPDDRNAWLVLGAEWYLSGRTKKAADVFLNHDEWGMAWISAHRAKAAATA